ncbi:OmpA family protein [Aerobium aerolatum]|uniref:Outer membrane protein OmpA n=1 Tax=Aquamicrobium aerolatum DSM 21857 TaxID=1121003 RepID=A0A1I3KIA1_9HYPH|nr:OmpA family protein [Aquamicrobium aerolatum]SFI72212.1 Outer membrane protein OmpA [Aquamicrobium aerolatum DSM 21857]
MKKQTRILTGTALALVMAAGSGIAAPQRPGSPSVVDARIAHGQIFLAQADEELSEEELRRRQQQEGDSAPAEQQSAPESEVDEPAPPVEEPAEQPAPPPAEEPAPAPEQPAPPPVEEPATPEAPPAPQEAPAEPTPAQPPVPQEAPATPPAETAPAAEEPAPTPEQPPVPETPPAQETPQAAPTPEAQPAAPAPAEQPAAETPAQPAAPTPSEAAPAAPAPAEPAPVAPAPAPEKEAPLFDSQKEGETGQPAPAAEAAPTAPAQPATPPPATDAEAQQLEAPVEVQPLRAEEGRRIERRSERRERREGADVLGEIGDRIILQFGGQTIVQSDDRDRIGRDASEVYYEELPRGRTRETVTRPNGVQVVTIRDRYGDVVRRSRITPDGHEYVLVYAEDRERERDRGERRQWRDPARDLPPLRIDIPRDEYILDARRAQEPEDYYEFFEQPPVEPIRRLYSIDEVKYSARVRDSVRRVDMDTITFEFGAATISESEIGRLESVADAMARLLERNPAETFLIEGHTDAVGSDQANLALSDRRAESVAAALTNVFGIPPENLVTQGYGERYLKVNSQAPERENRRVAMRRITPLVAPVAQAR